MNQKRSLANVTGILLVVGNCLSILGGVLLMCLAKTFAKAASEAQEHITLGGYSGSVTVRDNDLYDQVVTMCMIFGVILMAVAVLGIWIGIKLQSNAKNKRNITGLLVGACILSFFTCLGIFILICAIIALCIEDKRVGSGSNNGNDFDSYVRRLKQYLNDGIITKAQYDQKLNEAIRKRAEMI